MTILIWQSFTILFFLSRKRSEKLDVNKFNLRLISHYVLEKKKNYETLPNLLREKNYSISCLCRIKTNEYTVSGNGMAFELSRRKLQFQDLLFFRRFAIFHRQRSMPLKAKVYGDSHAIQGRVISYSL